MPGNHKAQMGFDDILQFTFNANLYNKQFVYLKCMHVGNLDFMLNAALVISNNFEINRINYSKGRNLVQM